MVRLLLLVQAARASHTRLRQLADFPSVRAARASHTRLRQLADFPSLILRSSFAEGSVVIRLM